MKRAYYESFIRLLLGGNFKWLLLIITAAKEDERGRSKKVMKGENQVVKQPQIQDTTDIFWAAVTQEVERVTGRPLVRIPAPPSLERDDSLCHPSMYECMCQWVNLTSAIKCFERSLDWKSTTETHKDTSTTQVAKSINSRQLV